MIRLRRVAAGVAAWILGAGASIGVVLLALALVGEDLRGDDSRALADATVQTDATIPTDPMVLPSSSPSSSPSAGPGPSASPDPGPPDGTDRRLTSAGGDVVARCSAEGAYLAYWSPAQGFRAHDVVRGPAPTARLTFEGSARELQLRITCAGGVPTLQVVDDDDEGGS